MKSQNTNLKVTNLIITINKMIYIMKSLNMRYGDWAASSYINACHCESKSQTHSKLKLKTNRAHWCFSKYQ